jgi:hypothetical protein
MKKLLLLAVVALSAVSANAQTKTFTESNYYMDIPVAKAQENLSTIIGDDGKPVKGYIAIVKSCIGLPDQAVFIAETKVDAVNKPFKSGNYALFLLAHNEKKGYTIANIDPDGISERDLKKSQSSTAKQTAKANRATNPNGGQSTGGQILSTLLQVGCGYANAQGIWIPCPGQQVFNPGQQQGGLNPNAQQGPWW